MRKARTIVVRARATGLALLTVLSGLSPAGADQKDARLPALFAALKQAATPEAAAAIEAKIWAIWLEAGDPELDRLMAEGSAAMDAQDFPTALARFDALIANRPDFAEGWNKRATLYYLMGDYVKSIADIDRTLELEPRHIGALSGLGLCNLQLEREEAAADAFRRVLDIDPSNAAAKRNLDLVNDILKRKSI
jgi:tetratricopeptide (TPR) repeat protein